MLDKLFNNYFATNTNLTRATIHHPSPNKAWDPQGNNQSLLHNEIILLGIFDDGLGWVGARGFEYEKIKNKSEGWIEYMLGFEPTSIFFFNMKYRLSYTSHWFNQM